MASTLPRLLFLSLLSLLLASCRASAENRLEESVEALASVDEDDEFQDRFESLMEGPAVKLDDVAIGVISGRQEYFNPAADTILQWAPRGALLKVPGKCPCNFRAALKTLQKKHPDAKWFFVSDDDTFVLLPRLVNFLAEEADATLPTVVAGEALAKFQDKCGQPSAFGSPHTLFGGSGVAISAALMKSIDWDAAPCRQDLMDSDIELSCFLSKVWKPEWKLITPPSSYGFGNTGSRQGDETAKELRYVFPEQVVVHRVSSELMTKLVYNREEYIARQTVDDILKQNITVPDAGCTADSLMNSLAEASSRKEPAHMVSVATEADASLHIQHADNHHGAASQLMRRDANSPM